MPSVIVYYAHPGQRHSTVNRAMQSSLDSFDEFTRVDLYHEYPRHDIDIEKEQARLLEHDVIVFQFPFFWYSTPSLMKEWQDLVLEYGFAYGQGGDKLAGKSVLLAVTAGGGEADYTPDGRNGCSVRELLLPLERTCKLCQMHFVTPYVLFSSLSSENQDNVDSHVSMYTKLLKAIQSGALKLESIQSPDTLDSHRVEQLLREIP